MYDSECAGAVKRNRASLLDLREAGAAPDACILLESARRRREADYCSSFILTTRRIFFSWFFLCNTHAPPRPLYRLPRAAGGLGFTSLSCTP